MQDRWAYPVKIAVDGTTRLVFNNTQATEILLMGWPVRHGWHHRTAQEAILRSMRSPDDASLQERARETFAAAAREAGILLSGAADSTLRVGYHLISHDGSETFTTKKELADGLAAEGWMIVAYLALPIIATDAMISAGDNELSRLLNAGRHAFPEDGIQRVLAAAFAPLNQKQLLR